MRRTLKTGDSLQFGEVDLVMIFNLATDTVEFCLDSPTENEVLYCDPETEKKYPVQWEDGVAYVEIEDQADDTAAEVLKKLLQRLNEDIPWESSMLTSSQIANLDEVITEAEELLKKMGIDPYGA